MINIAVIGVGAISDSHIQAYLMFKEQCQLVALVDLYPDKARQKAEKYGLQIPIFKDTQELIDGCNCDAASICLPPFEHATASIALLRAGKHVLVEKPMATCLEECDAMIEAARSSGKLLSIVAQNRFKNPMSKLKRILDMGLVGRILHGQVNSLWWRGSNYYDLWWRGTWAKEGGGVTMNHAVHHIDLLQWMMGMPKQIHAFSANLCHENSEVEDFSTAVLLYENGSVGQITASLVHHGEDQEMLFQGEKGLVALPWQVRAMKQKENGFPDENQEWVAEIQKAYDQLSPLQLEGHDGQIANFLAAIEGRESLLVDAEQGRRTLELITAIYQSSHLNRAVQLPMQLHDPFYCREEILRCVKHYHEKTKSVENFSSNEITLGRNYSSK